MAGKSNKGRNLRGSHNSTTSSEQVGSSDTSLKDNVASSKPSDLDSNGSSHPKSELTEHEALNSSSQPKQGDRHVYPVPVKTQSRKKLELQLNPGDSVKNIRKFLLDAPETCYFTCYDLLLHTKDGLTHHLEDYNEISEVADITIGGCSLEMVAALYDDRSIRAHVHRTRDLLSLSTLHASLSTSLALQYENAQSKASNSEDAPKTEFPELDGLGLMEDVPGSLDKLLSSSSNEIKCVQNIFFSSFNPPPTYRRLVGDLIYLDIETLEGKKYCITGTTKRFYVNASTGNVLDPRPVKAGYEATTLVGILREISSKFNKDHKRDAARAEDALTTSYGSELISMQRDWNEELQSCREFPHTTPQERLLPVDPRGADSNAREDLNSVPFEPVPPIEPVPPLEPVPPNVGNHLIHVPLNVETEPINQILCEESTFKIVMAFVAALLTVIQSLPQAVPICWAAIAFSLLFFALNVLDHSYFHIKNFDYCRTSSEKRIYGMFVCIILILSLVQCFLATMLLVTTSKERVSYFFSVLLIYVVFCIYTLKEILVIFCEKVRDRDRPRFGGIRQVNIYENLSKLWRIMCLDRGLQDEQDELERTPLI